MTKLKHTGVLKLAAVIIAVLMAHSGAFSESATLWYAVSSINPNVFSSFAFSDMVTNPDASLQIECPDDISTYTDYNECTTEITNGLNVTVSSGTLASLIWKMTGASKDKSPSTGINQIERYAFNTGVTFVDYTATDASGKRVECSFTVVVEDNQFPILTAPKNITVYCNDRIPTPYTTLQAFLNAGGEALDNCRIMASGFRLQSEKKDKNFCPYTITRLYQVADYAGNITLAQQSIIVDVQTIEGGIKKCITKEPSTFGTGVNEFLKILDVTFHTQGRSRHGRPRINKRGSVKDREQKLANKYYD